MNRGKYGEDLKNNLFSEEVHEETWTPQTVIKAGTAAPTIRILLHMV
jgi:hypothetical protein